MGQLTQEEFARSLGLSTSEVRRWEQGRRAPTAAQAIVLGKLAGAPECWFWWALAGLSQQDVAKALSSRPGAGQPVASKHSAGRVAEETRIQLATALETILQRAPSAVIEEIARILTDRAGKYGEPR